MWLQRIKPVDGDGVEHIQPLMPLRNSRSTGNCRSRELASSGDSRADAAIAPRRRVA